MAHTKIRRAATPYENLTLVPSGPNCQLDRDAPRPWPLADRDAAGDGAFVLVDSPPLLPVSDARILASRSDHVILTVAAGKEKPSDPAQRDRLAEFTGAAILGVVLNQAWTTRGLRLLPATAAREAADQPSVQ